MACVRRWLRLLMETPSIAVALVAFSLVALAEVGDKSQLVCMVLARRGSGWAVFWGASIAFAALNLLAVWLGAGFDRIVPVPFDSLVVGLLFLWFGIAMLRDAADGDADDVEPQHAGALFRTAVLSILVAEFGDKTQFSMAGLSIEYPAWPVWVGGTLGLMLLTGLAVTLGRQLLTRVPLGVVHRVAGTVFFAIALVSLFRFLEALLS